MVKMCSDKIIHDKMLPIQSFLMVQNLVNSWIRYLMQTFKSGYQVRSCEIIQDSYCDIYE